MATDWHPINETHRGSVRLPRYPPSVVLFTDAEWCRVVTVFYPNLILWLVRISRHLYREAMMWLQVFWLAYRVWLVSLPAIPYAIPSP